MSDSVDETARYASIARILLVAVGLPMFIFGLVGNLINSIVFTSVPQFNQLSISVFLFSSFMASEVTLLVGLLPQLVYRISGTDPLAKYAILCKLRWYLGPAGGSVALHYLCIAVINQYLVTSRQFRYHQFITRRRATLITLFLALFWLGTLSPALIFFTTLVNLNNSTVCSVNNPFFAVYNAYLSIVVYSLIPICFLSLFSVLTWRNVRKNVIRRRELEQTLTRLLLAQIVMVLFTAVPNVINQLYFFYTRTIPKSSLRLAQESVASSVFTLFVYTAHSFSFYTYVLTSKAFRENIRSIFIFREHRVQPATLPYHMQARIRAQTDAPSRR